MTNEPATTQQAEFVFRRLAESLRFGGREVSGYAWLALLVPLGFLALGYAGWMYARERRTIGRGWAACLGLLRCLVYLLLAAIFLLPAWQIWDTGEERSRVLLLLDVSGSMGTKDDLPSEATPVEKLPSRRDKVLQLLTGNSAQFVKALQQRNPVSAYRFGAVLDEESVPLDPAKPLTADEWLRWLQPNPRQPIREDLPESEKVRLRKRLDLEALLVGGTNVADALMTVLNREGNHMLQAVVLVSDGRSTRFSTQSLNELRARAEATKVPVFSVAVGEHRQPVAIRITDVQAPDQARPDDKFPVRVEVDGEGLAGQAIDASLDVNKPNGEKLTLKPLLAPGESALFRPGEPPHAQLEFEVDKPELEGEWKLVARIPREKREAFAKREHTSDVVTVHVVKRPLRVLLFAGGPSRDYQFVRTLLVRETDRRRAELSICLQSATPDAVQDVPPERLLRQFPTTLGTEAGASAEERYYDLGQYDLIIAFDPDWTQLTADQLGLLEKWVGTHAGGLIVVAGPVNTFQLVRGTNFEKLRLLLDLFPVSLEDSRLQGLGMDRPTAEPWRLNFPGASTDTEFLKLDEESRDQLAGWDQFFNGPKGGARQGPPRHGFYTYYPARAVKPSATVVATFTDPRARLADGKEQPYFVTMPYGNGKVVYLSAGETWRLRQYKEIYYERFWSKLARYGGSGNLSRASRHGNIYMGKTFRANDTVTVRARLFGRDLQPLPAAAKPRAEVKTPSGVTMPTTVELSPQAGQDPGWFNGRFQVPAAGNYELQLPIPGGGDVLNWKFVVTEYDPELDNTTPDFALLRQVASDAGPVFARVGGDVQAHLREELTRTSGPSHAEAGEKESPKLLFDLKSAALIPQCMVTEHKTIRSRGPVRDLWDEGFAIGRSDPPPKIAYALLAVVGLLSVEWLARKLLKLA